MATDNLPLSLIEAVVYFADPAKASDFVAKMRWADGNPVCPNCEGKEHYYLASRRVWKCKLCKKQFSVKVGTIFEDSPLSLSKWLPAVWLLANSKNGVSSHELGRALGVTQKTAWFMLHRIREAMRSGSVNKLDGTVEVDETYVGGLAKNMHAKDRRERITGGGGVNKTAVVGALKRGGEVRAELITDLSSAGLQVYVRDNVADDSLVLTDSASAYKGLRWNFEHGSTDHAAGQYVDGIIHTNGIESFWALLKRSIKGTYIAIAPKHLQAYLDERAFAYNNREEHDLYRFISAVRSISGRRITYQELVAKG
ncbi:MAG TPA: IS1595 family transposase [Pseudolysinimonas sp.]|jgi:transposase-like protein|nr:IS1595 family transposase [Pseudolysinimonas sp.]